MTSTNGSLAGSFRDPSGFVFAENGHIHRQVNHVYKDDYDLLMSSGLYEKLVASELLIPHEEVDIDLARTGDAYKVLKPQPIPFVSYPYEWCFSELKDAALATLAVQKRAFEHGMVLKDSSAFNIQFLQGKPVLIDTLSFEKYREGMPWVAYRQFCQHFLAPLALMSCRDVRLGQLLRIHIDGIPLDLASRLLPMRTRLRFSLLAHIHLHARSQKRHEGETVDIERRKVSRLGFRGIIDSLGSAVKKLSWKPAGTEWAEYYEETNYSPEALDAKARLVGRVLDKTDAKVVWDLGANTGRFSRVASGRGFLTISFDVDPAAVEKNYLDCKADGETRVLPLLSDLTNPTPGIGWENEERSSLLERGPADTVLALALIHHLAISNNLPLDRIARFFSGLCRFLVVEWVPKSDSQVQRLLATREDIFVNYTREGFERAFTAHFTLDESVAITDTQRTLYLMRKR